jgi:DNA mismatch repair protein MutL
MGNIRLLSDETASQVAAGEVVERPASIVKELAENSLDAGASTISIEFVHGGVKSIAVEDDGCGMDRDDALLSLERHATSKIRSAADLVHVATMGFRGEAIPSIAGVSRMRMLTRPRDQDSGTEIHIEGGRLVGVRDAGCAPGTRIESRDLFFNVPARKKFLRGVETESAQILQVVHGLALAAEEVALRYCRDGREIHALAAADSLGTRVRDLFGRSFFERLIPLPRFEADGMVLSGFVAKPGEGRRDRLQQIVILNGRPIQCPEVIQPLREAYTGLLPAGSHPIAILRLDVQHPLVDCNVHPAKRQVRFSRPDAMRRAVFDAVRKALDHARPSAPTHPRAWEPSDPFLPHKPELPISPPTAPRPASTPSAEVAPPPEPSPNPSHQPPPTPPQSGDPIPFRVLGRIGTHFLVLEGPEGLVLFDTRSARERIDFERLLRQIEAGEAPCQRLLIPEVVEMPAREHAWICENLPALRDAGFLIEPFGGMTVKIEGVPALSGSAPPHQILHEVAATLRAAGRLPRGRGLHEVLAKAVCRSIATSAPLPETTLLVSELLRCDLPYASPFGNPTMIQFSFAELERKFGRA